MSETPQAQHEKTAVVLAYAGAALPLLRRAQEVKPRDNVQEFLERVERIAQSR